MTTDRLRVAVARIANQVARWPAWLPSARINLGLDIAGGSQLLLEADIADAANGGHRELERGALFGKPLGVAPDDRERGAQLVRHVGEEITPLRLIHLETAGHGFE